MPRPPLSRLYQRETPCNPSMKQNIHIIQHYETDHSLEDCSHSWILTLNLSRVIYNSRLDACRLFLSALTKSLFAYLRSYCSLGITLILYPALNTGSFFPLALTQSKFAHLERHYSLGLTLILVLFRECSLFLLALTLSTVAHLRRHHSLGLYLF